MEGVEFDHELFSRPYRYSPRGVNTFIIKIQYRKARLLLPELDYLDAVKKHASSLAQLRILVSAVRFRP